MVGGLRCAALLTRPFPADQGRADVTRRPWPGFPASTSNAHAYAHAHATAQGPPTLRLPLDSPVAVAVAGPLSSPLPLAGQPPWDRAQFPVHEIKNREAVVCRFAYTTVRPREHAPFPTPAYNARTALRQQQRQFSAHLIPQEWSPVLRIPIESRLCPPHLPRRASDCVCPAYHCDFLAQGRAGVITIHLPPTDGRTRKAGPPETRLSSNGAVEGVLAGTAARLRGVGRRRP